MKNREREIVTILPNELNIQNLPWCREARLLSRKDPGCPTCESLLATGWGLAEANAPELEAVRQTLNDGFTHIEDAISDLAPLLGLLATGLYVIADGDAYPADGDGRFFWDVPDELTAAPATAGVLLNDDDYEYAYVGGAPVFLYPSQRRSRFDPERVAYYEQRLQQDGPPPNAVAFHCAEGISVLLDGHHKAAAAARLGRSSMSHHPAGGGQLSAVQNSRQEAGAAVGLVPSDDRPNAGYPRKILAGLRAL